MTKKIGINFAKDKEETLVTTNDEGFPIVGDKQFDTTLRNKINNEKINFISWIQYSINATQISSTI